MNIFLAVMCNVVYLVEGEARVPGAGGGGEEAEEAGVRGQGTGVAREAGGLGQLRGQTPHPGGHGARGGVISLTNNILSKS